MLLIYNEPADPPPTIAAADPPPSEETEMHGLPEKFEIANEPGVAYDRPGAIQGSIAAKGEQRPVRLAPVPIGAGTTVCSDSEPRRRGVDVELVAALLVNMAGALRSDCAQSARRAILLVDRIVRDEPRDSVLHTHGPCFADALAERIDRAGPPRSARPFPPNRGPQRWW
jgi:hypothetical protein